MYMYNRTGLETSNKVTAEKALKYLSNMYPYMNPKIVECILWEPCVVIKEGSRPPCDYTLLADDYEIPENSSLFIHNGFYSCAWYQQVSTSYKDKKGNKYIYYVVQFETEEKTLCDFSFKAYNSMFDQARLFIPPPILTSTIPL